jgi:glyceraldehyde 3-phosphate dehydrogenase
MNLRGAINGFGRTGCRALRAAYAQHGQLEVVAINDLVGAPTLAHLLEHDTVFGRYAVRAPLPTESIVDLAARSAARAPAAA